MKILILSAALTAFSFGIQNLNSSVIPSTTISTIKTSYNVEIKKSPSFNGAELETVYTIICTNTIDKTQIRIFELIKTDSKLKNYFAAEFVIIEKLNAPEIKYYPLGWESTKIKLEDLKSDCLNILSNDIKPVDING